MRRAIALHHEFMGRLHATLNVQRKLRLHREKLASLERELEDYVTQDRLPWILPAGTMFDKKEEG